MDWFVVNVVQTLVTSGSGAGVEQAAHCTKAASLDDRKTLFINEGDRKASMYVTFCACACVMHIISYLKVPGVLRFRLDNISKHHSHQTDKNPYQSFQVYLTL
jgi:hypothetical protein